MDLGCSGLEDSGVVETRQKVKDVRLHFLAWLLSWGKFWCLLFKTLTTKKKKREEEEEEEEEKGK